MKLSKITNNKNSEQWQLQTLFNIPIQAYQPPTILGTLPLSYIFIESIIRSRTLIETGTWQNTLDAGMVKLKALLTPDTSDDLETILGLLDYGNTKVAHQKLQTIKQLITIAGKEKTPIVNNTRWWQALFQIFEPSLETQKDIINQVRQEFQVEPVALNQTPTNNTNQGEPPNIAGLEQQVQALQQQIAQLRGTPQIENAITELALQLLRENTIQHHLQIIGNNMAIILGLKAPTLSNNDWHQNLGKILLETAPTHISLANIRAAKLAIQILTEKHRNQLIEKLSAVGFDAKGALATLQDMLRIAPDIQAKRLSTKNPQIRQIIDDSAAILKILQRGAT